ncbi:MAG: 30S ribosomal protein S8 [Candidatus Roizmanbacteria bacterium]|nr:30S ribosomal protein S8 [Candidatus Roizmanbacteria bacterium]
MSVIDLIIRIKNGYMAKVEGVETPYSKYRESVLVKLKELKYIEDFQVSGDVLKNIHIDLRYIEGVPAMTDVKLFSKPGKRMYTPYKDIKRVKGGMGHAILSSSKGILTDRQAKKASVGGELLFHIW